MPNDHRVTQMQLVVTRTRSPHYLSNVLLSFEFSIGDARSCTSIGDALGPNDERV